LRTGGKKIENSIWSGYLYFIKAEPDPERNCSIQKKIGILKKEKK
jgi:hypothetical protein